MSTFRYDAKSSLFRTKFGELLSLADIRQLVVQGETIQILDINRNEDVTHATLRKILQSELEESEVSNTANREIEQLLRAIQQSSRSGTNLDSKRAFDMNTLIGWSEFMLNYGEACYTDFGHRYYSWDYFLLKATIVTHQWRDNQAVDLDTAIDSIKRGSRKTRLARLMNVVSEGWVVRSHHVEDRRRTMLHVPDSGQVFARDHLSRTLLDAIDCIKTTLIFKTSIAAIIQVVTTRNDGQIDQSYLVPWAEFIMSCCDSWEDHFGTELTRLEYWDLYSRVVDASWKNEEVTFDTLSKHLRIGSARTHRLQIDRSIELNLIARTKTVADRRVSSYAPTPRLEQLIESHYTRTLHRFIALVESFPLP